MLGNSRLALLGLLALLAAPSQTLLLGAGRAPSALTMRRPVSLASSSIVTVQMQEQDGGGGGGERSRERGRTITVARPKPKPKQERKESVDNEKSWRVLLHNDDVRAAACVGIRSQHESHGLVQLCRCC